jgi:hypothetical protein
VLLVIEVGYKFRFFGEDAKVMKWNKVEGLCWVEYEIGAHVSLSFFIPGRIEGTSYCSFCWSQLLCRKHTCTPVVCPRAKVRRG